MVMEIGSGRRHVARLAGGVARQLDGTLDIVLARARRALEDVSPARRQDMEAIVDASERAAIFLNRLRVLSGQVDRAREIVNLNQILLGMEKIVRQAVGSVTVEIELDRRLDSILANRGLMELIILTIAENARDAMPDGGEFHIATRNACLRQKSPDGVAVGRYAGMAFRDTGPGIRQPVLRRLFQPFFTTKPSGSLGLGLYATYAAVKQHGGEIVVSSEWGKGTTFHVYLPSTL